MKMTEDIKKQIIKFYIEEKFTIYKISNILGLSRRTISKYLKSKGIKITLKDRNRKKYRMTDEHKKKISIISKSRKGKKTTIEHIYKNMAAHLRYDVEYTWLIKYDDLEKLKFLNSAVVRKRDFNFNTEIYKKYIHTFYYDTKFNVIYNKWIENDKNKWLKPSLDHIIPNKNGSLDDISNLEFLTWFENRAKNDIDINEWKQMKKDIYFYLT